MTILSRADSFYKKNVLERKDEISFLPSLANEDNTQVSKFDSLPDYSRIRMKEHRRGIYYISDIHLDHKLFKKFGRNGTFNKTAKFIEEIVDNLFCDDDGNEIRFSWPAATILILGDTSHSFEINKLFYETLSKKCEYYRDIFVVLGNHELWEFESVDEALTKYNNLFSKLSNIHLLQNSLYADRSFKMPNEYLKLQDERSRIIFDKSLTKKAREKALEKNWKKIEDFLSNKYGKTQEERHKTFINKRILDWKKITKMSPEEIRDVCLDSKEIIFGAIGFSPLNTNFNAKDGIYRKSIKSVEQEKELAKVTSGIYEKLSLALPNNYLVIASHMPLEDWTKLPAIDKWVYFNGHTHINKIVSDERGRFYADNQVGYNGKRIKFNAILSEHRYDYFAYYEDGIYNITKTDYHRYYNGLSKRMVSVDAKSDEKIKMLKNGGIYLFLLETKSGKLYLLEGGRRRVLKRQDVNYYYDNLAKVNFVIEETIKSSGIRDYLNQLSLFVKRIGGSGYIHGVIVDIDFFDHIMVDFRNLKLIPYFAYSINDRYEYPDLPKLLQDSRPDLYKRFIANGGSSSLPVLKGAKSLSQAVKHNADTSIYSDSNMMLKIQDMLDYNVMRFWNDDLIDSINDRASGYLDSPRKLS